MGGPESSPSIKSCSTRSWAARWRACSTRFAIKLLALVNCPAATCSSMNSCAVSDNCTMMDIVCLLTSAKASSLYHISPSDFRPTLIYSIQEMVQVVVHVPFVGYAAHSSHSLRCLGAIHERQRRH